MRSLTGPGLKIERLAKQGLIEGNRWLLPQTEQARDTLADGLARLGAQVERVTAYRSVPATELAAEVRAALERRAIQWITITSPNSAKALHALALPYVEQLKPISLSPAISDTLRELGWPAAAEAQEATEESLLEALLAAIGD